VTITGVADGIDCCASAGVAIKVNNKAVAMVFMGDSRLLTSLRTETLPTDC
jgi:hypothetical protein